MENGNFANFQTHAISISHKPTHTLIRIIKWLKQFLDNASLKNHTKKMLNENEEKLRGGPIVRKSF